MIRQAAAYATAATIGSLVGTMVGTMVGVTIVLIINEKIKDTSNVDSMDIDYPTISLGEVDLDGPQ